MWRIPSSAHEFYLTVVPLGGDFSAVNIFGGRGHGAEVPHPAAPTSKWAGGEGREPASTHLPHVTKRAETWNTRTVIWVHGTVSDLKHRNGTDVWPVSNEENAGPKDGKLPKPPIPPNPLEKNEPPVRLLLIPRCCCCRRPPPKKSSPNGSSPTAEPQLRISLTYYIITTKKRSIHKPALLSEMLL